MSIKNRMMQGAALVGATLALPALAYDVEQISINGFGSVIAAQTLDSDETLYGNDNDLSFENESRFALQVAAPIGEKFSATAQIMARGSDEFSPEFEWAYISYQATDNFMVMAGRQRFSLYKYSDYVDVGYAYHWVRPPQGVYSIPFNSGNGLGFLYNTALGDVDFNFTYKFVGEEISDYVPSGTDEEPANFKTTMSHLFNFDFTWSDLNFGMNYGLVPELSYEASRLEPLKTVLPASYLSEILVEDETMNFFGAYIGYDPGDWFVLAEYTYGKFDDPNALADQKSFYVSGGVRINQLTIHGTYGLDDNEPSSDVYKKISNPMLSGLVKAAVSAQEEDSETYSLGVRWDVDSGVALKADYTTYSDDLDKTADADLISAGIDFVF
ncbi:OprO/OprP family phosphate-selective porin [Alkalimarinus alittae]|uniref:OprO/OprP family phosphate-selective porin n=1 Tax=Alkalimarinus alittae TaxID=2961619 RepID=A0ABY6N2E4_9ALTE|nr:OprO/OprP family phosphate-selective porin [Alkalimarinus alittae]UZE96281.1 OprO/OprP family phosphate-selective porin [Alkalimarinus alittae]